jgi:hypothetical protein
MTLHKFLVFIDCKQLCVYRCSDQTFQPSVTAVLRGGKEMSGSLSAKYVPGICNSHLAVMPWANMTMGTESFLKMSQNSDCMLDIEERNFSSFDNSYLNPI